MDAHRRAELYLQDAAMALVDDTPKQAAEAFHEVFKAFTELGYTDYYFMQSRERAIRVAEMAANLTYFEQADGTRTSVIRDKLERAEMELGKESITVH